jgi:5-methylcytosine-specific restriction endonuclease McrA
MSGKYIRTKEIREKLRKATKAYFADPKKRREHGNKLKELGIKPPSRKGIPNTPEARKKISEALKGEKCHFWRGGISTYERKLWLNSRRKAKKFGADGNHTFGEWETLKAQYGWTCPCCGKVEPKIKLTEDHIIPISKGGSDNIENIQPLCGSCNSRKNTKIINFGQRITAEELL